MRACGCACDRVVAEGEVVRSSCGNSCAVNRGEVVLVLDSSVSNESKTNRAEDERERLEALAREQ